MASSMSSAARSTSPPARAWPIACGVSPSASNQAPARRCSSATSVGVLVEQVRAEDVGEQVVVAVPLPPVVERDDEEVGALERHQGRLAAVASRDGVAERPGESLEDRRPQQELADVRRLAGEDLLAEIVHDVAVVARRTRR